MYSRCEVAALRQQLAVSQQEHTQKMQRYAQEERSIREENLRWVIQMRKACSKLENFICTLDCIGNCNWRWNGVKLCAVIYQKVKVLWRWRTRGIIMNNRCWRHVSILFLRFLTIHRLHKAGLLVQVFFVYGICFNKKKKTLNSEMH